MVNNTYKFLLSDLKKIKGVGVKTANILKRLGGKVNKIYPVGSLFMEERWFKKKKRFKQSEKY